MKSDPPIHHVKISNNYFQDGETKTNLDVTVSSVNEEVQLEIVEHDIPIETQIDEHEDENSKKQEDAEPDNKTQDKTIKTNGTKKLSPGTQMTLDHFLAGKMDPKSDRYFCLPDVGNIITWGSIFVLFVFNVRIFFK